MKIVQPVQILPEPPGKEGPISDIYHPYQGKELEITLKNRTKLPGIIKYSVGSFQNDLTGPKFGDAPEPHIVYEKPFKLSGGFSIRAQLFSPDGKPIDVVTTDKPKYYPMRQRYEDGIAHNNNAKAKATFYADLREQGSYDQ